MGQRKGKKTGGREREMDGRREGGRGCGRMEGWRKEKKRYKGMKERKKFLK